MSRQVERADRFQSALARMPELETWDLPEIPGTITHGKSLDECRRNLRDALTLMVETHRDEARLGLDPSCIQESIEIDVVEPPGAPEEMQPVFEAEASEASPQQAMA